MERRTRDVACLVAFLAAVVPIPTGAREAPPSTGVDLEAGRVTYERNCAQCHGVTGDGRGTASARLRPSPRDFTSGTFKIRTTPSGELPTDDDLISVIRRGMPYTAMPAWPSLDDSEIGDVVAYLKTFNEDFADPDMQIPAIVIPDPPSSSDESIRRGREVYLANKCFDCHGQYGRGDGPSAPTLKDDWGQPIRPADLTKRWTFRGGRGRADIYRTFTTGLNGTPMPSYADSIEEQDRWDLVDYVYSLSDDAADYGTLVVARKVDEEIAADPTSLVFSSVEPTRLPLVGQITDPGRLFHPATNAVEVRAVYNDDVLAIQIAWNAMSVSREGTNQPGGHAPPAEGVVLSDAVAVQLPATLPDGPAKPYFLYGDPANPVDLWFYDAGTDGAVVYRGSGEALVRRASGSSETPRVQARGVYGDGLWRVVFVSPRGATDAETAAFLPDSTFIPIALSVWSGQAGETGNRRAITSWYHLYLAPPETAFAYTFGGAVALSILGLELLVAASVRRRHLHPHRFQQEE